MRKTIKVFGAAVALAFSCYGNASEQEEEGGFFAGSHLTLMSRNYYWHQTGDLGHQRDWTQGEMLDFTSGYTPGIVGLGVDAFAYGVIKLDGRAGRVGSMTLPYDNNGKPLDDYSKAGASIKAKVSNTVLRYGDLQPQVPVFAVGNYYLINQTARGWMLESSDIDKLDVKAGRFTSGTGYMSTSSKGELGLSYAGVNTRSVDFVGGTYLLSDALSATLYGSRYADVMNQYYSNVNYVWALSDTQSLTFDFNLYRTLDSGQANAGSISVTAASLSAAFATGPHTFAVALQHNHGDQPQDYAAIGARDPGHAAGVFSNGIFLANASELSDFNAPNERSIQLRYELDFGPLGVPGLHLIAKHIRGDHIDGSNLPETSAYFGLYGASEKEHETDVIAKYVVQGGALKNLELKAFQSWHSGAQSTGGSLMQTRLVVSYPFDFF